ncbi:MAG TPA: dTDP-4-dehydrorhamnose reductase [Candidatus Solibacter sp.]|nr:dTDP-4-dehydrorhamnose reductase [Candidatus Solibacter sp.]
MKVAVLGANGQLGMDVTAAYLAQGDEVVALTHEDVEVSSLESVRKSLESIRPDVVINCAAFANVERCEDEPAPAFAVNATGARNVAQITDLLGGKLVHISTDYVFDGAKSTAYIEQDQPGPLNVYGNSKLSGEYFVRCANSRHFVVRVSGIYGHNPCRAKKGLNFVELMLKLARERNEVRVVDDQLVTPTPTIEIARQLTLLSRTADYGIYHATSEGSCSWYEFARVIFELTGANVRLERANPGDFPTKARRPKNSVLENAALKSRSLNIFTHWREGLETYLAGRKKAGEAGLA